MLTKTNHQITMFGCAILGSLAVPGSVVYYLMWGWSVLAGILFVYTDK